MRLRHRRGPSIRWISPVGPTESGCRRLGSGCRAIAGDRVSSTSTTCSFPVRSPWTRRRGATSSPSTERDGRRPDPAKKTWKRNTPEVSLGAPPFSIVEGREDTWASGGIRGKETESQRVRRFSVPFRDLAGCPRFLHLWGNPLEHNGSQDPRHARKETTALCRGPDP